MSIDVSFECDDDVGIISKKKVRLVRRKMKKREREEKNEDRKIFDLISLFYWDLKFNVFI